MILYDFIKKLQKAKVEKTAKFVSFPNNKEPVLKFDGKCSVCNAWGFDTDNYCAKCGAKFEKE